MPFSAGCVRTKEWHDICYRKHPQMGYLVYWGDRLLGHVFDGAANWDGWWSLSYDDPQHIAKGFITRHKAVEHMLKLARIWPWNSQEEMEWIEAE